jgi:hypothetical protein
MTPGAPAGVPDGHTLARWWAALAPLGPRALWAGHLTLHHLDAPVRATRPARLDPFLRSLLLTVAAAPGSTLAQLDDRLHCGANLLARWLYDLLTADLVRADADTYAVTPRGGVALAGGDYPHPEPQRRRFTFVTGPAGVPHYVPWAAAPGRHDPALPPAEVRWLAECVARPADWKRRFGFPEDVEAVAAPAPGLPPAEAWRRVAVASSERVAVALVLTEAGRLLGFAPAAGGALTPAAPALRFDDGGAEVFPELAGEPAGPVAEVGEGWRLVGAGRLRRAVASVGD